jgi:tuberous sclerosis protein 2
VAFTVLDPLGVSGGSGSDIVKPRDSTARHRSGILSSVSEESDLLPLTTGHSATPKSHHSSLSASAPATVHGGINPSFVFLQVFQNHCFRNRTDKDDTLIPLPTTDATAKLVSHLDMISPYETHKLGVIYIKPGQTKNEVAILSNMHGSVRYMDFIQKLGDIVRLSECDHLSTYIGGMDHRTDGPFVYVWHDEFIQVVFHITTLMPCHADDPQCTGKKLHIGNDYVTIVYNDSGEDYRMGTIKSQFNFVNIMIQPLDQGTNCVTVQTKPEIEDMIGHTDTKIISDVNLALLVRQMAIHANLASTIYVRQKLHPMNPYASNWLERLRWIRTMRERTTTERAKSEPVEVRLMASTSKPITCDDFSDFVK